MRSAGVPWRPELRTVSPPTVSFVFLAACTVSVLDCATFRRIHSLCVRRGDVPPPSVYQGMYNGLTRDVERELFPCLRALNMAFFAVASMRLRI